MHETDNVDRRGGLRVGSSLPLREGSEPVRTVSDARGCMRLRS